MSGSWLSFVFVAKRTSQDTVWQELFCFDKWWFCSWGLLWYFLSAIWLYWKSLASSGKHILIDGRKVKRLFIAFLNYLGSTRWCCTLIGGVLCNYWLFWCSSLRDSIAKYCGNYQLWLTSSGGSNFPILLPALCLWPKVLCFCFCVFWVWEIPPILIGLGITPHPHLRFSFLCFEQDGFQSILC